MTRLTPAWHEYLGTTDIAIVAYRRLLLRAIEQAARGEPPPMALSEAEARLMRGPVAFDGIGPADARKGYWREADRRRRLASSWAAGRLPE